MRRALGHTTTLAHCLCAIVLLATISSIAPGVHALGAVKLDAHAPMTWGTSSGNIGDHAEGRWQNEEDAAKKSEQVINELDGKVTSVFVIQVSLHIFREGKSKKRKTNGTARMRTHQGPAICAP